MVKLVQDAVATLPKLGTPAQTFHKLAKMPELKDCPPAGGVKTHDECYMRTLNRLVNHHVATHFGKTRTSFVHYSDRGNWTEEQQAFARGLVGMCCERIKDFLL